MTELVLLSLVLSTAPPTVVDVWGQAPIEAGGDLEPARALALERALERAVKKRGIEVTSTFQAEQSERGSGSDRTARVDVRDHVRAQASGFVESWEILEETRAEGALKLRVRARVFASKRDAERARRRAKLKAWKKRTVALAFADPLPGAPVRTGLIAELLDTGLEVDADDPAVRIEGSVEVASRGPIEPPPGLSALTGQTRVVLQVHISAKAGERLIGTRSLRAVGIGIDEERALHRALNGRGNNLVRRLSDQILSDISNLAAR